MKKIAIALTAFVLSASLLLPGQSFADTGIQPFVIEGKVVQGRTLVPVRTVSAGLGAEVIWNQKAQTVTIIEGSNKIILTINSNKVTLNGKEITIDVPAQVNQGTTYVPIRMISQALGGKLTYDAPTSVVDISLGDKQVRITTESTYNYSEVPQQTINALIKKANEATNLSAYSQIRTHFQSYFTDTYINKIIKEKGLQNKTVFTETAFSQSSEKTGRITQYKGEIERTIELKYVNNKWLVDNIRFTTVYP